MIRGRSPVVRSAIRAASPLALLVAAFLFFAGHNQPGGGFAAGLVIGAVVALRTVAGIGRPQDATRWFAVGTALVSVVALAPLLGGEPLLHACNLLLGGELGSKVGARALTTRLHLGELGLHLVEIIGVGRCRGLDERRLGETAAGCLALVMLDNT